MAKRRSKHKKEVRNRSIYVLIFENERAFFVGKTVIENLWKVFDSHFRGQNALTRELFQDYIQAQKLPKMFLLNKITGTDNDAFQYCIAWSKFFFEKGYKVLAGEKMEEFIADSDPAMEQLYQQIRDIKVDEICSEKHTLFPEFGNSSKRKRSASSTQDPDKIRIEVILKKNEYLYFKKLAKEYGVSMSQLFLHFARHGDYIRMDTRALEEYVRTMKGSSNMLSGIISTILLSMQYFPSDIDRLCEVSEKMIETNREAKQEIERLCRAISRMSKSITTDDI